MQRGGSASWLSSGGYIKHPLTHIGYFKKEWWKIHNNAKEKQSNYEVAKKKNFVQYTYEVWRDIAAWGKFSFLAIIPPTRFPYWLFPDKKLLCRREYFFFDPFGIMPTWITETVQIDSPSWLNSSFLSFFSHLKLTFFSFLL